MCHGSPNPTDSQSDAPSCPFTIRQLNSTTWLIREHDCFGEYPHIYVRKCSQTDDDGKSATVLVVNDTGVGTTHPDSDSKLAPEWSIRTFLDKHLNPSGTIPYLVILSHCHFDHILGLPSLLSSPHCTVLSSSYDRSFTTPHKHLEEHSLCQSLDLECPIYETTWADDRETVVYPHPSGAEMDLPIVTLHTPGHTPDSFTWFDTSERVLYVGDSFYSQTSPSTASTPWGPERPAPIIFPKEGDLGDWWRSLNTLLSFVEEKNRDEGEEETVKLSAGHVTAGVDALGFLTRVKAFMGRVLRDHVPFVSAPERRDEAFGYWTDNTEGFVGEFSLGAPVRVIEEGRKMIPGGEWLGD